MFLRRTSRTHHDQGAVTCLKSTRVGLKRTVFDHKRQVGFGGANGLRVHSLKLFGQRDKGPPVVVGFRIGRPVQRLGEFEFEHCVARKRDAEADPGRRQLV